MIVHPSLPIQLPLFKLILIVCICTYYYQSYNLLPVFYYYTIHNFFEMTKQLAPGARLEGKVAIVTG